MPYIYLTIAIILEVIATSFLKTSEGFTRLIPSIVVVLGYSGAFFCFISGFKDYACGNCLCHMGRRRHNLDNNSSSDCVQTNARFAFDHRNWPDC